MTLQKMYRFIKEYLIFFLFGKPSLVKEIECMSPEEYHKKAVASHHEHALFSYKDPLVQTLIWNIKYRKNIAFLKLIAKILQKEIPIRTYFQDPLIIPVPLSDTRRRERGYNQIEEILKYIEGFNIENTLVKKIKHTKNQTKLTRKERRQNLQDVFIVTNTQRIINREVVVIDDVITTGTTLTKIAQTLKKVGAKKVFVLAIAH